MNGSDFFDQQPDGRGGYSGPRLQGSLFVPSGMGIVFVDSNGAFWKQGLVLNTDGTTWFDENGLPSLQVQQVTL